MKLVLALGSAVAVLLTACQSTVAGTVTWPGATLERVVLTAADLPDGVRYERIIDEPADVGGDAPAASALPSEPAGCTDGMTQVIEANAERGPGAAIEYSVGYDGARVLTTVLSFPLDLDGLAATAARCARFEAFFDRQSTGIPMTTAELPGPDGALVYEQTMSLAGAARSVYMAFQNVGTLAVFAMAVPENNADVSVKAALPQTFLEQFERQADKLATG